MQGALTLMYELQEMLAEIAGFAAVTLQPAAGAHGELTGMLIMRAVSLRPGRVRARHASWCPTRRTAPIRPPPAMAGFKVVEVPSDAGGNVDLDALRALIDDTAQLVGLMLTNPNTLGLFDEHMLEVLRARPRVRRADLRRRREHERDAGHRQAGRPRLRRDALQPAQDLLDAARRRRPGLGRGGRVREAGRFLPGPIVAQGESDGLLHCDRCRRSRSAG